MEQTTSTKGKGLGTAGMVVGIVALVWACIPYLGAGALWIGVIGLVLSVIAFFMAKSGGNPKKGMIVTGIVLSFIATGLAGFWIYKIKQAADAFQTLGTEMMEQNMNK